MRHCPADRGQVARRRDGDDVGIGSQPGQSGREVDSARVGQSQIEQHEFDRRTCRHSRGSRTVRVLRGARRRHHFESADPGEVVAMRLHE